MCAGPDSLQRWDEQLRTARAVGVVGAVLIPHTLLVEAEKRKGRAQATSKPMARAHTRSAEASSPHFVSFGVGIKGVDAIRRGAGRHRWRVCVCVRA